MYSFVFISICVWQNMNLVIIEDAYMNVKYKSAHSWLTGDDGGDDQPPNENEQHPHSGGGDGPQSPPSGPPPD